MTSATELEKAERGSRELEEDGGPYTCMKCCAPTWNDSDWCNRCTEESRTDMDPDNG